MAGKTKDKLGRERKNGGPRSGGAEVRGPLAAMTTLRLSGKGITGVLWGEVTTQKVFRTWGPSGRMEWETLKTGEIGSTGDISGDMVTQRGSES